MRNCAPLISVVLPVYNVAPYIKECLDSILNQTIQDFEILIIDDCSTDNTISIIKTYYDLRIKIIEKTENKGLIDSLNYGFKMATGKYIARVDGDDINALDRFEKQLNFLDMNSDIDACGCWLKVFGFYERLIKHHQYHNVIQSKLLLSCPMSLGSCMLRKSSFLNCNLDNTMKHVEDYDFWARTAWDCKFYNLQEVLYYYRTHENQVSTKFKQIQLDNDIRIKLNLWKKIPYNQNLFRDVFIVKMLMSNRTFEPSEYKLLIKWFKELIFINKNLKVYDKDQFEKVLNSINRNIIFSVYFNNARKGFNIAKRFKLLKELSFMNAFYVLKKKINEKRKLVFNKLCLRNEVRK